MSRAKSSPEQRVARPAPVFPAPDHDHDRCSTDAMAVAEARCIKRGRRLTPIRREVLAVLLSSHQPLGAYEIMERLAPKSYMIVPLAARGRVLGCMTLPSTR